jgi:uncharacterized protein YndB with AHSA1/START domain
MEANDGSNGFDFDGTYKKVEPWRYLSIILRDGRNVEVSFLPNDSGTKVTELFDAEDRSPVYMQRAGWQSILNNFKKFVEASPPKQ